MQTFERFKNKCEEKQIWELLIYLFFGGLTTLVNLVIHFICLDFFHWHYLIATVIAWVFSVLFAFITNKLWVFQSKSTKLNNWLIEGAKFIFYRLVSLGMDVAMMFFLIGILNTTNVFAKLSTQILVVIVNYIFSKFLIFTKK